MTDLSNREVIGWSAKSKITTELAPDAMAMAWFRRQPEPGVLFHSDRVSQYTSRAYQAHLAKHGMRGSMLRIGNCQGNAPTERFVNSLKNERVRGTSYANRNDTTSDLFQYIAVFHNRIRCHSTLRYLLSTTFSQNCGERRDQKKRQHESGRLFRWFTGSCITLLSV